MKALSIFLKSNSADNPWIVVSALRPVLCWIRMSYVVTVLIRYILTQGRWEGVMRSGGEGKWRGGERSGGEERGSGGEKKRSRIRI